MANSKDRQDNGPAEITRTTIRKRWDFGYDGGKPKVMPGKNGKKLWKTPDKSTTPSNRKA
jgi:hypothetical protein